MNAAATNTAPAISKSLFARDAWLPAGWASDVRIELDAHGRIVAVTADANSDGAEHLAGPVLPAMPNLHSHAFQRAMAGRAERRSNASSDDFWSWRETMYAVAAKLTPDLAYAIAAQLYKELAHAGYCAVAEFHYVHRQPNGKPYANPAEMALAHVRAARDVGLAITLLPVIYERGGFDDRPLSARQARFAASPSEAFAIAQAVRAAYPNDPDVRVGLAPHSLRAVRPNSIDELATHARVEGWPIHLHIAEQPQEVADCTATHGTSPVQWLLDRVALDARWCLVHATHLNAAELAAIAQSGATVGLCPTTEANLGDGIFPFESFQAQAGRFGVGSDSNVSRSPIEELRLLEYGQRLRAQRRNVSATAAESAVAAQLWRCAAAGGAQALGRGTGAIAEGNPCDLIVLDTDQDALLGIERDYLLDALVFSGDIQSVRDTIVSGRHVIQHGRHPNTREEFRRAIRALFSAA